MTALKLATHTGLPAAAVSCGAAIPGAGAAGLSEWSRDVWVLSPADAFDSDPPRPAAHRSVPRQRGPIVGRRPVRPHPPAHRRRRSPAALPGPTYSVPRLWVTASCPSVTPVSGAPSRVSRKCSMNPVSSSRHCSTASRSGAAILRSAAPTHRHSDAPGPSRSASSNASPLRYPHELIHCFPHCCDHRFHPWG